MSQPAPELPVVPASGAQIYRRLLGYIRPHSGLVVVGILGMVLFAATDVSQAYFVNYFLRSAVEVEPSAQWLVPLGALLLFLLRGVGDYISSYFPGAVGRRVIKALRGELFAHYLRLPVSWYDRESTGPMLSRLTFTIEQMAEAAANSVTILVRDTLTLIGLVAYMVYLSWQLTLLALIVAPVIGFLMRVVNRSFRRYSGRIQNSMGDVTRVSKESLEAHRVVRVFNAETRQEAAFERANELNRHTNLKLINAKAMSNPIVQGVASIGLAIVLWFAIWQVLHQNLRVETFLTFIAALLMLTAPLRRLVNVSGSLQQAISAGASVFAVLDLPLEHAGGTRPLGRASGEIRFGHVGFAYGPENGAVLHDVDLAVGAGQTVALVGRSGSGKTTLVSLVPRFHDATQGTVAIDGADVREYALTDLRRQISYVGQEVVLFDDTIRANISFGRPEASAEQVEAAARAAHVWEFASALPEGLDTMAGDRGARLSGGQRQRIAIARALLKDAPILILDEATSALDSESERLIQDALEELVRGRTTLVIAHRLSTIENADRIVVMDQGRIAEQGTHAELLAKGGLYAQLHRLQFDA
ncbi:MAG: lipid A export permease/ATP-binding protein MsbA [Steroidobacteraceae bacterium]